MTTHCIKGCYIHFTQRVAERIGDGVDPKLLWDIVIREIERNSSPHLTFIRRLNRKGRRLWRISLKGKFYFIVFDHEINCPITVLPPKGEAKCHGDIPGESVNLEEYI